MGRNKSSEIADKASSQNLELDLGLSGLVPDQQSGSLNSSESEDKKDQTEKPGSAASSSSDSESVKVVEGSLASLAAKKQWRELSLKCEGIIESFRLGSTDSDGSADSLEQIEARVWWAKSQIALGEMPVALLAAPIDSAQLRLAGFKEKQQAGTINLNSADSERLALLERVSSELLAALNEEDKTIGAPGAVSSWPRSEDVESKYSSADKSLRSSASNSSKLTILGILFFVVIILVYLYLSASSASNFSIPRGLLLDDSSKVSSSLIAPEPERSSKINQLDFIMYDIEKHEALPKNKVTSGSSDGSSDKGQALRPSMDSVGQASDAKSSSVEKESVKGNATGSVVNTDQPIEPKEIANLRKNPNRGSSDVISSSSDPNLDRELNSERPRSVFDRTYIEPRFETFPRPKFVEVQRMTDVMDSPSLTGRKRGTLRPGDTLSAEGMEGYWLRIKSKQGRIGYVLAEHTSYVSSSLHP